MQSSTLILCSVLLALSPFHVTSGMECWNGCSYQCWNSKSNNVDSPSHFLIDTNEQRIVLTAKNSVCHISLDLSTVENVRDVTPPPVTVSACTGNPHYEIPEKCHNFHHILLLPIAPSNSTMVGDGTTPLDDTVLECGSNAFNPKCNYRMRSNLSSVTVVDGSDYVPNDVGYAYTTSLWLTTGRLVSATSLSVGVFGLVMSEVPYNGGIQVGTVSAWFDRSVQFVSMYEIGDYIYTFFREDPDETSRDVIYSRVSRVCKNDMGVTDTINPFPLDHNVFTTFLKARMTCVSGGDSGIPYYYDQLQDTFLVESQNFDGSIERTLYGIFTSPENGPVGSAVCAYAFSGGERADGYPTLETVFEGDYLTEISLNQFNRISNDNPVTCSGSRDAMEVNSQHLMFDTVQQISRNKLHLHLTGYSLTKILVSRTVDLSGAGHDVMYITANKYGSLLLLKVVYDSANEKSHIVSEQEIKLSEDPQTVFDDDLPRVIHMQFLGNGSDVETDAIFVGTTEALYRFPLANCARYTGDCCACVASRDPHCGYNPSTKECVVVTGNSGTDSAQLLQDVARGDIGVCSNPPDSDMTPPSSTDSVSMDINMLSTTSTLVFLRPTSKPTTPPAEGVLRSETGQNNLWTIIGAIFSFVGGVVLGIFVMALCYRNKGRFVWSKLVTPRRPTVQPQSQPPSNKGASNKDVTGASNVVSKAGEYERNNSEFNPHGNNPAQVVHIDPISNLPYSKHHHGNGKRGSNNDDVPPPPPYSAKKSVPLPGKVKMPLDESDTGDATPITSLHSMSEHRTPEKKINKALPMALALETPPKSTTPSSAHSTSSSAQTTPSKPTPSHSTPLTLTPVKAPAAHRHPYRQRAYSHTQGPPLSGYYSTLPSKKRHASSSQSETTPPERPSSAEVPPNLPLPRPASAQNLRHVHQTRGVAMATTPTKHRAGGMVATSPFSATQPHGTVAPSSPYNSGSSAAGTPTSTTATTPRFKFPPTKLPPEGMVATPTQWRGRGNPNIKATGYAVEPTTNQEMAAYGNNMAPRIHTLDRKNKLQNGHAHRARSPPVAGPHPQPHPETTVIEIDGGLIGCTDC